MGLDMYLHKNHYVGGWDHSNEDEKRKFNKIMSLFDEDVAPGSPHVDVNICVAYWRKANQIHNWFVQNIQFGEDNCQKSHVSREQLQALLDVCTKALKCKDNPETLDVLPPSEGFFFGTQEIDAWYWQDVEYTFDVLTKLLSKETNGYEEFIYQASW